MKIEQVFAIRREKLAEVVARCSDKGTVAEFARLYNLNETFIRQLLGRNRNIGEKVARELEEQLGLQFMELDGLTFSSDELKLINRYRERSEKGKQLVMGVAESAPSSHQEGPKAP